jgi:hypothetical protein
MPLQVSYPAPRGRGSPSLLNSDGPMPRRFAGPSSFVEAARGRVACGGSTRTLSRGASWFTLDHMRNNQYSLRILQSVRVRRIHSAQAVEQILM